MTEDDFLRRFDEHLVIGNDHLARGSDHLARGSELLARGNELHERGNELHERGNELMDENRRAFAAHQQAMQDIRLELKQMSLRGERIAQGYLRVLDDMSDQLRANTQAVLLALDEFKRGDGPATAGAT